jgi:hypothetical protein
VFYLPIVSYKRETIWSIQVNTTEGVDDKQIEENLKHIKLKLTVEDSESLNTEITEQEISQAIVGMKNDKSPGEDGIIKEFYHKFWDILKDEFVELFTKMKIEKEQPESHKNAIIKLLYKKDDHRKLKNWRPISLLNIDYKIFAKVLTNRLKKVMSNIVPKEQKCGVPERKMTEIIRNISNYRDEMESGFLILLDQAKAFDRVNHQYLFKVMKEMGIKGDFLEITKMLYNKITSQVEINGARTEHVNITRGVRQGCPFSMLLFVLATVPLIEMINDNKKIKGYKTQRNNIIKIQSYADDNTIIIKNPNEITEIMKVYTLHAKASEAKINEEKTKIFPIGKKNNNSAELAFREKICDKVKILGATFCTTKDEETKENLTKPHKFLDRMEKLYYSASLMGKILRLHTYIYSLIYSNAWLINTNSKDFTNFMGKVGRFLCRTKSKKALEKVSNKIEEGGLNLINLKERLESIKIKDILEANINIPETDDIIYKCGTKQKKIFGTNFSGPKEELTNPNFKELLNKIERHIETIKNFKKRYKTKTIKPKAIQTIILVRELRHF